MGLNTFSGCRSFSVTLMSGKTVTAEMEVSMVYDPNYGADADGRRGRGVWLVDELGPTVDVQDPEWEVDDAGESLSDDEKIEAMKLLEEEAENYDWEEEMGQRLSEESGEEWD
jgi:hypothetical protein